MRRTTIKYKWVPMVGVECNLIEGGSIVYQRNVLQDQINYFVIHLFKKI